MRRGRWLILAVWLYGVTNYLDRVAMSFAGPSIMKSLHISPVTFGAILSSFSVGYALSQLPGGILADRWKPKPIVIIAPLVWAVLTGVTGLVSTASAFIALRVGLGVAEGIALGAVFKIQFDNFPSEQRSIVASIGLTPIAVAPALAGPLVGTLVSTDGWQAAFFALTVPSIGIAVVNYFLIPSSSLLEAEQPSNRPTAGSFSEIVRLRSFWVIAATWFCFNFAYWGYNGWMPSFLAMERHVDIKTMGYLAGLPFAIGLIGMIFFGWLGTRMHEYRPQLLAICYLGAAAGLFVAYSAASVSGSVAGLSMTAFFLFSGTSGIYALAADLSPDVSRGTYWGAVSALGQLAGALAPITVGQLISLTGTFSAGLFVMIVMLLIACALVLLLLLDYRSKLRSFNPAVPQRQG